MAQKTVCDACGADIVEADTRPVEFRGNRLHFTAQRDTYIGGGWRTVDICAACFHAAADAHDKSPRVAPMPYGPFRWLVTLAGVRTPGPHAGFMSELDARKFVAADADGQAEVKPA